MRKVESGESRRIGKGNRIRREEILRGTFDAGRCNAADAYATTSSGGSPAASLTIEHENTELVPLRGGEKHCSISRSKITILTLHRTPPPPMLIHAKDIHTSPTPSQSDLNRP